MASTVELHKGTRNFWRQRTNVDVSIIEHVELKVLELIAFNADVHKEVRLYIAYAGILARVDAGKAETMIAAKKEEYLRRKKAVAEKDIRNDVLGSLIAEHLLNRMSITYDKEASQFEITISATPSDEFTVDYIIEKPVVLLPYPIDRLQKNSSASEIADTIEKLKNDSLMLSRAMEKAERMQKIVNMGGEGFKMLMVTAQANRTKMNETYSLPKQRWLKAINRIILRNCVQKVKDRIEAFEEKARKKMNDALVLAISVADARTESSVNPLSPRLQPLTGRAGAVGAPAHPAIVKSGAKSARVRRQTAETPNVRRDVGDLPAISHTNPLASLLGGAGSSVAAAASAAAGALSSLTHAVEGALHKSKEKVPEPDASQKSKSTRSRRRSTLESKITPTDKSAKSERITRKNSFRKEGAGSAVAAALEAELDAAPSEEEYNFRLRRVTEMPVDKIPNDADETETTALALSAVENAPDSTAAGAQAGSEEAGKSPTGTARITPIDSGVNVPPPDVPPPTAE